MFDESGVIFFIILKLSLIILFILQASSVTRFLDNYFFYRIFRYRKNIIKRSFIADLLKTVFSPVKKQGKLAVYLFLAIIFILLLLLLNFLPFGLTPLENLFGLPGSYPIEEFILPLYLFTFIFISLLTDVVIEKSCEEKNPGWLIFVNLPVLIPMVLCFVSLFFSAESINILKIAETQKISSWSFITQPAGFFVLFSAIVYQQTARQIYLREAGSFATLSSRRNQGKEIIFIETAWNTLLAVSAIMISLVFWGGYELPFIRSEWTAHYVEQIYQLSVLFLKSFIILSLIIAVKYFLPYLNAGHLRRFSWSVLLPLSILNLLVTIIIFAF